MSEAGDVFLVLSNIIYLLPSWEAYVRYRFTRSALFFLLIFVSGSYHACDSSLNACILPIDVHHNLDFFFSQLLIPLTALYFVIWSPRYRFLERFFVMDFALAIFLVQALADTTQTLVQLIMVGVSLLIIVCVIPFYYKQYHWGYILGGLLVTLVSFVFFYFGPECYWAMHSLWHILSGIAQFLFLRLKDPPTAVGGGRILAMDSKIRINRLKNGR